jgi:transmembrane sensor
MPKSNYDDLMERYVTGQVTAEEKEKIELWLEARKANGQVYDDLTEPDQERIFKKITSQILVNESDVDFKKKKRISPSWLAGIAATLAIVSISFTLWLRYERTYAVTRQMLGDGTLVWLKGNSSLAYFEKRGGNLRSAALSGEALFEVAKDPSRPFVLAVGDYTIKVLGTSFNIRPRGGGLEVDVFTGRVHISSAMDSIGIIVESNQKVVYSGKPDQMQVPLSDEEKISAMQKTEYDMHFENASLGEVFEKIEAKFGVKTEVSNTKVFDCMIRADFTDQSLESTLMLLAGAVPIEYKIDGRNVVITGNGCEPKNEP